MTYRFPLSTLLSGTEALVREPQSSCNAIAVVSIDYKGTDVEDGLDCHVVYAEISFAGKPYNGMKLWLARDRNLIPMRSDAYTYHVSKSAALGIAHVEK